MTAAASAPHDAALRQALAARGIPWPAPARELGAPFVEIRDFRAAHHEFQFVEYGPPQPPLRTVPVMWDEDGNVEETRELSDEEFADDVAAYEQAVALWRRMGGRHRVAGPLVPAHATFATATGSTATGYFEPARGWLWLEMRGEFVRGT
jgi:hypothetical protein